MRYRGAVVRVEVAPGEIERLAAVMRERVVHRVKRAGSAYVALDLEGYRTGRMKKVLDPRARGADRE